MIRSHSLRKRTNRFHITKIYLILTIASLLFPGISFGQNTSIDSDLYSNTVNSFDLSGNPDLCYFRVYYTDPSSQYFTSKSTIINIDITDQRSSGFTTIRNVGYFRTDVISKSGDETKASQNSFYILYNGNIDTLYIKTSTTLVNSIKSNLSDFGYGDQGLRSQAFADLKGITITPDQPDDPSEEGQGEPLDVVPLVSVDLMSILAPIADFVKSGFGFPISVIYLSMIIYNVLLNRKKNIVKSEKRENRSIAQDVGVSTRRVSRLRDDYQVYRDNYGGSMSFRDYVELDKNNRIGASRRV